MIKHLQHYGDQEVIGKGVFLFRKILLHTIGETFRELI
jgi:hypothetical protein